MSKVQIGHSCKRQTSTQVGIWVTPFNMAVACVLTAWYVLLWPMFTTFSLRWVLLPDPSNSTVAIAWISDFHLRHEEVLNFYNSYVINLMTVAFQLTTVVVCSIAVSIRIVKMARKRKNMSNGAGVSASRVISSMEQKSGAAKSQLTVSTVASRASNRVVSMPRVDREESFIDQEALEEMACGQTKEVGCSEISTHPKNQMSKTKSDQKLPASNELKVIRMLLLVCLVYVIFIMPTFLLFVFQQLFKELREPRYMGGQLLATSVSMLLLAINSSANFIIYVYMS
ncbi:hypothetical protein PoB_001112300 [Plakobranchus ocellatus]|uniref:G-protein coupled receptors family 1 profile domain-containing protein n=1 Tax=Plakobranchus ocellatus TaxID=259542 RepID=A0AAV3YPY8_9GAST|nr:hypothetical protein PoB_001112300 [Plakobranchus ocellatus]